jgi:hypothetical protein
MRIVSSIDLPLKDEHVLATDPVMRPELPGVWLRRINAFIGRSLTAQALTAEQEARAGRIRLRGQGISTGLISGLDARAEPGAIGAAPAASAIQVSAGLGVAQSGEDVTVRTPRRVHLADLPVFVRVDWLDTLPRAADAASPPVVDDGGGTPPPGGALSVLPPPSPRSMVQSLGGLIASPIDGLLPRVAVLVAEPVTAELAGRGDPADPCPRDPSEDPYDDWRRIDGCRLALYLWPSEMVAARGPGGQRPPDYALPALGPTLRNRLSYSVFAVERGFLPGEMHPWERLGVPLAIVGFAPDWKLQFIDRGAVARVGGLANPRTFSVGQAGTPFLWQARVSQFVEHLADLDPASLTPGGLAQIVRQLPPFGLLPMAAFDPATRRQGFFPAGFSVRAVPVATEQLELAVRESASLVPFNLDVPDEVELMVPVPERVYEPGLLQTEAVDPAFAREIAGLVNERTTWHVRRELVRRRRDVLTDAISGQRAAWPQIDPEELPDERLPDPTRRAPAEASRIRRIVGAAGQQRHDFTGAQSSLQVAAGDRLYVWVRIALAAIPGGIALNPGIGTDTAGGGDWSHAVYWGTRDGLPDFAGDPATEPRRRGQLPPAGQWVRLEVAADAAWKSDGTGIAGLIVNGLGFEQSGGTVEWGPMGKLDRAGNETVYLADEAPAGAVLRVAGAPAGTAWPWQLVDPDDSRPTEADFGTLAQNDTRIAGALADFRGRWPQPFLTADVADLTELGIDGFSAAITLKLKTTNDAIDLGFVRARADIYRVRQYMLGADAASHLVTSPSLADIAVRDESARAKSDQIREFLTQAYTTQPGPGNPFVPPAAQATRAAATGNLLLSRGSLNISSTLLRETAPSIAGPALSPTTLSPAALSPAALRSTALSSTALSSIALTPAAVTPAAVSVAAAPVLTLFQPAAGSFALLTPPESSTFATASLAGLGLSTGARAISTIDVQTATPLIGYTERTASVAERLGDPAAAQAYKYAFEGKGIVRQSLVDLLTIQPRTELGGAPGRTGIALADLPLPGFALKAGVTPAAGRVAGTLSDLIAHPGDYDDLDVLPAAAGRHESDYFTAAVSAIDNAIALMRLVEGRIDLYNRLLADALTVHGALAGNVGDTDARLRTIEIEIAEARHDLAVATALLAEEQARVDAVNARRAAVLRDQARFLVFRRPRTVDRVTIAPTSPAAAALADPPVAVCLREHSSVPEVLRSMAALFREAPVRWFPPFWPHLPLLDTVDAVRGAFETVQRRAVVMLPLLQQPIDPPTDSTPKYLASTTRVFVAQRSVVAAQRMVGLQLNLAAFSQVNLTGAREQLKDAATLGDLMDGTHGRAALSRQAAQEVSQIAQVAECLHASFNDAAPIIRLGWAEMLSEFDQPVPLQTLSALPRWNELSLDLRREQQGFVDYLFSRIDRSNATVVGTMNDLVRVCVLMASHAPVDRIVSADLARAAPARPGIRLDLAVDLSQVRLGMSVLVRGAADTVLARGVVEDIAGGMAQARITNSPDPSVTIPQNARVHLTGSALLRA